MGKSKIYTKTGDRGQTSLVGGKRISKCDVRLEAYGTVDELNAHLGMLITSLPVLSSDTELLQFIQNKLFVVGSYLATDTSFTELREASHIKITDIERIERRIDEIDRVLPPLNRFILPGGVPAAAKAHICRTVCRRAERRICAVAEQNDIDDLILRFINRLSDYLFVLSRFINVEEGTEEIYWNKSCE
ncbi:cob(I)yrinic acid a,c-diamide adenosyltransferase [Coprobacter sp.]